MILKLYKWTDSMHPSDDKELFLDLPPNGEIKGTRIEGNPEMLKALGKGGRVTG